MIFACSILTLTAGSAPDKKGGTTLPPMFLLGTNNGMMQMVYWCDLEEPQLDEDYADYYEEIHQAWALQDQFRRNASKYTKLIVDGTETRDVKYVDEILLNPDGEKLFPGELHHAIGVTVTDDIDFLRLFGFHSVFFFHLLDDGRW